MYLTMELTAAVYAIIVRGVFSFLILTNISRKLWRAIQNQKIRVLRHLIYVSYGYQSTFFSRTMDSHPFFVRTIYLDVNLFFTIFRAKSVFETGIRAGALTLINMVPLFLGLHLSFIADLCGMLLKTYRFIHAAGVSMLFLLALYHVVLGLIHQSKKLLSQSAYIYGIIVSRFLFSACGNFANQKSVDHFWLH